MGRASRNVEFLDTLWSLSGLTKSKFATACGKRAGNMSKYLAGTLQPGKRVLASALRHYCEWGVDPLREIEPLPQNLNTLSTEAGVYVIYDSGGNVLYIGQATNFRHEVRQTLGRPIPVPIRFGPTLKKSHPRIGDLARYLSLYSVPSARARHNLEAILLRIVANQTHNTNIGSYR